MVKTEDYLSSFRTIQWAVDRVILLDQRLLPDREHYLTLHTVEEVADAIRSMAIRGAPAIGVAAAMAMALGSLKIKERGEDDPVGALEDYRRLLLSTRPTAVNLRWALERMWRVVEEFKGVEFQRLHEELVKEAVDIFQEDIRTNISIGEHGASLLPPGATVLTHCNAGALATAGYGTALGVVRSLHRKGMEVSVMACETRPFLQGARLTAWELWRDGIPVTVITDNMAGHYMQRGEINAVIVGADRIAANGDTANKIGTYSLAVLAKEHSIPFYVAAPLSTFDLTLKSGAGIPIEERSPEEVVKIGDVRVVPRGVEARYPAFDVTPHNLITSIITEKGVIESPLPQGISSLLELHEAR
jgi:methylthioribose-1-phosphate isomerase